MYRVNVSLIRTLYSTSRWISDTLHHTKHSFLHKTILPQPSEHKEHQHHLNHHARAFNILKLARIPKKKKHQKVIY